MIKSFDGFLIFIIIVKNNFVSVTNFSPRLFSDKFRGKLIVDGDI
jgi:hypothetical protein